MKSFNVRELKSNPSAALRQARDDLVVVMNRDKPDALLVHLDDQELLGMPGVRLALATALFRDGNLPVGRAARLARVTLVDFIQHLSRSGIPVVAGEAKDVRDDTETLDAWLARSS
jgi:predicted HTH domain antitoxin